MTCPVCIIVRCQRLDRNSVDVKSSVEGALHVAKNALDRKVGLMWIMNNHTC